MPSNIVRFETFRHIIRDDGRRKGEPGAIKEVEFQ